MLTYYGKLLNFIHMNNGKYRSIKSLMSRILMNPLMNELNESDVALYISDCLRLIEAPAIYENKVVDIDIKEHRGELPCDLIYIKQTRMYAGSNAKLRTPQSTYTTQLSRFVPMKYASDHFHTALHEQSSPDLMGTNGSELDYEVTYQINGDFIYTSFPDGKVQMSYQGLKVDEEGYPMIPDNVKVEKAIEAYIKVQHYTIMWELGKIADKVIQKAEQEYAWYVGAAETSMRSLTIDQAESLKAALTRTILKPLQHHNGFRNLGTQEYLHKGSI